MIGKKGISPLIATVLIIGFTIVLAALVIQWGGSLFKGIQQDTGVKSEVSTACSIGLANLDVKDAVYDGASVTFKADNKNEVTIQKFAYRLYDTSGNILLGGNGDVPDSRVDSFGLSTLIIPYGGELPAEISVFPFVKAQSDNKVYQCTNEFKIGVDSLI